MKRLLSFILLLVIASAASAAPNMLAWYQFEQNGLDSAGSNDGTASGTMGYEDGPVKFGHQRYAAAPDGASYYSLPLEAELQGQQGTTYSLWVNFSHTSDRKRIMGNFNSSDRRALRLTAVGTGELGQVDFWIRSSNDVSKTVTTGPGVVELNTWSHIAVTYDGSILKMYLNGEMVSEAPYSQTNFAAWDYPMILLAENMRGTVQGFYDGMIDDFRIYDAPLTAKEIGTIAKYKDVLAAPHDPMPVDGDTNISSDAILSWTASLDPNDLSRTNPEVKAHYVWMSSTNDPNLILVDTINVTDYSDPTADCVYDPANGVIAEDGKYDWYIEEAFSDGAGGMYPAGNENNITGPLWSFSAVETAPEILVQPASVKVEEGDMAEFTVEFFSAYSVTAKWYDGDDQEVVESDLVTISTDSDSSTLAISDVTSDDEGEYYCILASGSVTTSSRAILVTKRILCWYKFEQGLSDEISGDIATEISTLSFPERVEGDYAVSTDGTAYMELTTDAYPNGGFGNGLDEFTYTFWVNPSSSMGANGRIIGNFNDGSNTGMQIGVTNSGAVRCFLREEGNISAAIDTPANTVPLGSWSYVTITYDSSSIKYYINGSFAHQGTVATLTNFADWQYPVTYLSKNSRGAIVEPFAGEVDELVIYNYAIGEMDAAKLYYSSTGESVCIESYRPNAIYDINNDCIVDLKDFALFSQNWLSSGIYNAQ